MNKKSYSFYKLISQTRQMNLLGWSKRFLTEAFSEERVVATKDFLYAVGDVPIMLVAHLDTVHKDIPSDIFYDKGEGIMWSPQGLGADDRAGIFAIMTIIKNGFRPHILFTTNEEIGGIGALIASKELKPDVNFVIELDRRGKEDSVFYDCDNPEFEDYINKFGFSTSWGSFTDISYLCPSWGMAGVNLSIGYDNEHTKYESLNVNHMYSTIDKVQKIIQQLDIEKDVFKYIPMDLKCHPLDSDYLSFMEGYDRIDFAYSNTPSTSKYKRTDEVCYECYKGFSPELMISMGKEGQFCGDCYAKLFTTCIGCQTAFKDRTRKEVFCTDCFEKDINGKEA